MVDDWNRDALRIGRAPTVPVRSLESTVRRLWSSDQKFRFKHEDALISIVVTPKDCARCHNTEFQQMDGSRHAKAGDILASLHNLLGEVVGGPEAVNAGCRQCHGGTLEFVTEGKNKGRPLPGSWPNTGIGRINSDGSKGSCSAGHGRHRNSTRSSIKRDGNEKFAKALPAKHFKPIPGHDWCFSGMNKDAIDKVRAGFEDRYGKGSLK